MKIELPPGSQTFESVPDFHTIKPLGDKLAPQPPVVALTTTEASADPKGGARTECPPSQIDFED
eukprot:1581995-Lingulodinium_polyedra.AAC.1